jgi:hypothetical protein
MEKWQAERIAIENIAIWQTIRSQKNEKKGCRASLPYL